MTTHIAFKRVVVGLQQTAPEQTTVRLAAELAVMLRADLCGLFVEDPGMAGLASLPGAREYTLLGRQWRPLDPDSLARDIDMRARVARRLLDDAAKRFGVSSRFQTVKAAVGEALRTASAGGDIVIIAEPHAASERALAPFSQLLRAAFQSKAAVFYIPRRVVRRSGPVVAVAASPDDPSVATAMAIAASANESVVVLEVTDGDAVIARGEPEVTEGAVPVGRLRVARRALADIRSLSAALQGLDERMIVLSRGAYRADDYAMPAAFASLRGVPVLMMEPEPESDSAEVSGAAA